MTERRADHSGDPAGRRAAMRADLTRAFVAHHERRRARRRAAGVLGACIVVAIAAQLTIRIPPAPRPTGEPGSELADTPAARITIVRTSPQDLARFTRPKPAPNRITIVDDDTLLAELAAIDRPTGLIRMGDDVRVTRSVVDASPPDDA